MESEYKLTIEPSAPQPVIGTSSTLPKAAEPKPYNEVITTEAVTQTGLVKVHQVGQRWYLEIPMDVLDTDMLWYAEFSEAPLGMAMQPKKLGE